MKKQYYEKPSKEFRGEFNEKVNSAKSIVITTHISPDDDAVSCTLAVYEYITEYLKKTSTQMIVTGDQNPRWNYFKNYKRMKFTEDLSDHLKGVDLLIMLDGSDWYRFSRDKAISEFDGSTICIDHHPNPDDIHQLHLLSVDFVSCAEIVYKLFFEGKKIDKDLAEIILLGIWGDTGGLRFMRPENTSAFETVKKLIEIGNINVQTFASKYQKMNLKSFRLITELMKNTTIKEVEGWPPFQLSFMTRDSATSVEYLDFHFAYHFYVDTYMRMIDGADWGFVVYPGRDKSCGITMRSLPGSVNSSEMMKQLGGGGHDRAAGGTIKESDPEKAVEMVTDWMKKNKPTFS